MPADALHDKLIIGRIGSSFGVQGWVHVHSDTQPASNLCQYLQWYLSKDDQIYQVEEIRPHQNSFIAKLTGIDTPEQARLLANAQIGIPLRELPELPENEYYWNQLIGLNVITTQGASLGQVTTMLETGSNDVFVVSDGQSRHLIPYIDDFVVSIDLKQARLTVIWDPEQD